MARKGGDFDKILRSDNITLRLPTPRVLDDGFGKGFGDPKSGGIRWSPNLRVFSESIDDIPIHTVTQIRENMKRLGDLILQDAQYNAPWKSHPERHRGAEAKETFDKGVVRRKRKGFTNSRWPSPRTAKEGLFVYIRQRKTFIELGLSHDPKTIYVRNDGTAYNYGAVLETGFGGRYATVAPTLERHRRDVLEACTNALVARAQQIKPRPNHGGQTIASGWFKQAKKG